MSLTHLFELVAGIVAIGVAGLGVFLWWDLHTAKTQLKALDRHNDR